MLSLKFLILLLLHCVIILLRLILEKNAKNTFSLKKKKNLLTSDVASSFGLTYLVEFKYKKKKKMKPT